MGGARVVGQHVACVRRWEMGLFASARRLTAEAARDVAMPTLLRGAVRPSRCARGVNTGLQS